MIALPFHVALFFGPCFSFLLILFSALYVRGLAFDQAILPDFLREVSSPLDSWMEAPSQKSNSAILRELISVVILFDDAVLLSSLSDHLSYLSHPEPLIIQNALLTS